MSKRARKSAPKRRRPVPNYVNMSLSELATLCRLRFKQGRHAEVLAICKAMYSRETSSLVASNILFYAAISHASLGNTDIARACCSKLQTKHLEPWARCRIHNLIATLATDVHKKLANFSSALVYALDEYGTESPIACVTVYNIAICLMKLGRPAEARPLATKLLSVANGDMAIKAVHLITTIDNICV